MGRRGSNLVGFRPPAVLGLRGSDQSALFYYSLSSNNA